MPFETKKQVGHVAVVSPTDDDLPVSNGPDLEEHELVRSYIMANLDPIERCEEAGKVWQKIESRLGKHINAFLQHYAIQKYSYHHDKKKGISVSQSLQNRTEGQDVRELLDDIRIKSIYYTRILNPKTGDPIEKEVFSLFNQHPVKQFHPLILSLIHQRKNGNLSLEEYHSTLKFLYHFIVCYNVVGGGKLKRINDIAYEQAFLIETDFSPQRIDECLSLLKSYLPTLNSFKKSLREIGYSKHWLISSVRKKDCQLILGLVERHLSNQEIGMEVTIEHILPDCASVDHAQIGNLIYLEESLNGQCASKPLAKKYPIYDRSVLMCPREIAQRYRDKEFSPRDRTDYLAELLYNEIFGFGAKV